MTRKIFANTLKSCLRNAILLAAIFGSALMVLDNLVIFYEITMGVDALVDARSMIGFNAAYFPYRVMMFFFCGLVISWDCVADFATNHAELLSVSGLRTGRWFIGKLLAYAVLCFTVSLIVSFVIAAVRVDLSAFPAAELVDVKTIVRLIVQCIFVGASGFLTFSGLAIFFSQLFRKPAAGLLACVVYQFLMEVFINFGRIDLFRENHFLFLPDETVSYIYGYVGGAAVEYWESFVSNQQWMVEIELASDPYTVWGAWQGYLNVCLIGVALLIGGYLLSRARFRRFQ